MELARKAGLTVEQGVYPLAELAGADEAFVTNAVMEVTPLTSLDGAPIGDGQPGPVTRSLQSAYGNRVLAWRETER